MIHSQFVHHTLTKYEQEWPWFRWRRRIGQDYEITSTNVSTIWEVLYHACRPCPKTIWSKFKETIWCLILSSSPSLSRISENLNALKEWASGNSAWLTCSSFHISLHLYEKRTSSLFMASLAIATKLSAGICVPSDSVQSLRVFRIKFTNWKEIECVVNLQQSVWTYCFRAQ